MPATQRQGFRWLERVWVVILIGAFFLPWTEPIEMITSKAATGWTILGMSVIVGMMGSWLFFLTGLLILLVLICTLIVLVKSFASGQTKRWRRRVFWLSIGCFALQMIAATWMGMQQGKPFVTSVAYQFSFVRYGVYVELVAALALLFSKEVL